MEQENLYELMISRELTWEGLIRDIIQSEGMDPWDIDISKLTNRYMEAIRSLQQKDIKVSGKFLLAASMLLKMKSDYLFPAEEKEAFEKEISPELLEDIRRYELEPFVPQPKQRKVTLDELMSSLKQALVVEKRREVRTKEREDVKMPIRVKKVDISKKIIDLYEKILRLFASIGKELKFTKLVPSKHRWDIIWTFIPLIHLANKDKIRLRQEEDFGEIYVSRGEGNETGTGRESKD